MSPFPDWRTDGQTTKNRATQLVNSLKFKLSHAIVTAHDHRHSHLCYSRPLGQAWGSHGFQCHLHVHRPTLPDQHQVWKTQACPESWQLLMQELSSGYVQHCGQAWRLDGSLDRPLPHQPGCLWGPSARAPASLSLRRLRRPWRPLRPPSPRASWLPSAEHLRRYWADQEGRKINLEMWSGIKNILKKLMLYVDTDINTAEHVRDKSLN